jgi:hypothetical protein
MRGLDMNPLKFALLGAGLLAASACNQGALGYPGVFTGSTGSCTYPETGGYVACEDYLCTDYDTQLAQSLCANVAVGSWSQDSCATSSSLGTCIVVPDGTGDSQTFQYTYYASADPDSGVTGTALTAETACGVAGGVFTAAQ